MPKVPNVVFPKIRPGDLGVSSAFLKAESRAPDVPPTGHLTGRSAVNESPDGVNRGGKPLGRDGLARPPPRRAGPARRRGRFTVRSHPGKRPAIVDINALYPFRGKRRRIGFEPALRWPGAGPSSTATVGSHAEPSGRVGELTNSVSILPTNATGRTIPPRARESSVDLPPATDSSQCVNPVGGGGVALRGRAGHPGLRRRRDAIGPGQGQPNGPRRVYDEAKWSPGRRPRADGRALGLDAGIPRILHPYRPLLRAHDGLVDSGFLLPALNHGPLIGYLNNSRTRSFRNGDDSERGIPRCRTVRKPAR